MQGVGHIPYYAWRYAKLQCYDAAVREACESGKSRIYRGDNAWDASHGARVITLRPPCLLDVLYALVTDAEVLNYTCFEDWAESFGYDTDSRKAEKIYKDCLRIALQLRQIINIEEAAELFSDY